MTTGQVPRKAAYSWISRSRVLSAGMAVSFGCLAAGLLIVTGQLKTGSAAAGSTEEWQLTQDVVVPPVKRQKPSDAAAPPAPAPSAPAAEAEPYAQGGLFSTLQDWLARANREYQGVVVKELSSPPTASPSSTPGNDPIAKKLEEQQREDAAKAAAEKRDAEAKRLAEDRRRAEETKRLADEASRKADEILKDITPPQQQPTETAEEQRREAQKVADENRRQEEQRQAELRRREDAERKRLAAAEAARAEAARADAANQEAARRRSEEAAYNQMHRRRTIQLTVEPIDRPEIDRPESVERPVAQTWQSSARYASYRPVTVEHAHAGTAVKRWVRRVATHAQSCRAAGRRVAVPGRYTVKSGDSLWRISKRHYHKGKLYKRIYAANRSRIRNPDLIYPCQRVFVPRKRR